MASVQTRRQLRMKEKSAIAESADSSCIGDSEEFIIDTSRSVTNFKRHSPSVSPATSQSAIDIRKNPSSVSESIDKPLQTPSRITVNSTVEKLKLLHVADWSARASSKASDIVEGRKMITPVLARLKNGSSGNNLEDVRASLLVKHQEAKDRIDSLCVGGGISIWPDMEDMRLSKYDVVILMLGAVFLGVSTYFLFNFLHGLLLSDLNSYWLAVVSIKHLYPLVMDRDNTSFVTSVLEWHRYHKQLVDDIHESFDVSLRNAPPSYTVGVVVYVVSIALLLYYLADNVLAKSRLTPRRIKQWVLLLTVSATWTLLGLRLFIAAHQLESAVKTNVYTFNEHLGDLLSSRFDLSVYRDVMTYWRTRCLLAASPPLLYIMGLVAVSDIYYYLQYYSLPVVSALLLPIVRLAWAFMEIYKPQPSQRQ